MSRRPVEAFRRWLLARPFWVRASIGTMIIVPLMPVCILIAMCVGAIKEARYVPHNIKFLWTEDW